LLPISCYGNFQPVTEERKAINLASIQIMLLVIQAIANSGVVLLNSKLKSNGIDVEDPTNSLQLGIPTVQFDDNPPYPVENS
jgi:hypothetical protein